jgi:peptidoglycan/xylan/chitin deacetylase (PgdA/CDA1 family)
VHFLLTTDVELTSIPLSRPAPEMAEKVLKVGLPRILDLYSKYDVKGTFFFTGKIVEIEPRVVHIVKERGHEIGCHGYTHYSNEGFDTMPYVRQVEYLRKAKRVIENEAGPIVSFRSPELRIGKDTVRALEETGFEIDCSIASQRFDGPMSYGSYNKLKWLLAPRRPYYLSYKSPFRPGCSSIFEIPVSALVLPYIGTFMRMSPKLFRALEITLFREVSHTNRPLVFLFHPNECIWGKPKERNRFSKGLVEKLRDEIKGDLKIRNLGIPAIGILEKTLKRAREKGFEFVSVKEFREIWKERLVG